jgi:Tol biopolymer transport system component
MASAEQQASGAISLDNQTLAYVAYRSFGQGDPADVVLAAPDGSNPRTIWQASVTRRSGSISFAPDGARLAVSVWSGRNSQGNVSDIWVLGVGGDNPHMVVAGRSPAWRPAQ